MLALGAVGYWIHANARQGSGGLPLAQSPLNVEDRVPSSFIMMVDDSNSMTFERIFSGGDGRLQWSGSSFFSSNGVFFNASAQCDGTGTYVGSNDCYLYLFPYGTDNSDTAADRYNQSYYPGRAIPPIDIFGFARSPAYNNSYYNPTVTYEPWLRADGSKWPQATPTAARVEPRAGFYNSAHIFDLTQLRARTGRHDKFPFRSGMRIPSGVRYATGTAWSTAPAAGISTGNTMYAIEYYPATFYLPENDPAPAGYKTDNANRPVIAGACGPTCNLRRYEIKPENYTDGGRYTADMQNFANWFQYHRSRLIAMVGSMTYAFSDVKNMRVGYATINNLVGNVTMRDLTDDTQKASLYTSMMTLGPSGGTPNRAAVDYVGQQFLRTDAAAPVLRSCQKNAGMLFTDGYSNTGTPWTTNFDLAMGSPFADNFGGTMADIAARYYFTPRAQNGFVPLRTGGDFPTGKVPVPEQCDTLATNDPNRLRLDCQRDLHMNFYGITLGVKGAIYGVNHAATNDPYANPPNWNSLGNPTTQEGGVVIDEIWHATINARGEFINAQTPQDVTDAMRRVLAAFGTGSGQSGTIAVSGSRVSDSSNSLLLDPSYASENNGTDWYSRLVARRPEIQNGVLVTVNAWPGGGDASNLIPAADARNILVARANPSGVAPDVREFKANVGITSVNELCSNALANCTNGDLTSLGVSLPDAVNYLRGDISKQVNQGGTLRTRTTRLGDIINSTPKIVAGKDDYGYRSLRNPNGLSYDRDHFGYQAFFDNKKASQRTMVYVGANDGMLHAFDGETGVERLGYIPSTALGHMGNLLFPYNPANRADQIFQHRYFVDGPLTVGDVYSGAWRTMLIGTAGAGGRSIFALDITNPNSLTAGKVLWEISDQLSDTVLSSNNGMVIKNNIGHVLGRPVIVPVNRNGIVSWKVIFGNGYNSVDGKAVLFIVDAVTGVVETITANESDGTLPAQNGLGNIVVVDRYNYNGSYVRGTDGYADTVYAGDQNGAVWKFDLRTPANVTQPLFVAKNPSGARQAITGGFVAARGAGGGVMLYFGTGSFSFQTDPEDKSIQTFYGVLDKEDGTTVSGRGVLQAQQMTAVADGARMVTTNIIGAGKLGWYLDLAVSSGATLLQNGERAVGTPAIESGVVFFTTYEPSASDGCGASGSNRLYGLSAINGGASMSSVRRGSMSGTTVGAGVGGVSLTTSGSAPVKDIGVLATSRMSPLSDGATQAEIIDALANNQCAMVIQVAGSEPLFMPRPCGRQSWRQVR
jgi:type IV pilus assembly protein PilY1